VLHDAEPHGGVVFRRQLHTDRTTMLLRLVPAIRTLEKMLKGFYKLSLAATQCRRTMAI
jgi:hypothetical protein